MIVADRSQSQKLQPRGLALTLLLLLLLVLAYFMFKKGSNGSSFAGIMNPNLIYCGAENRTDDYFTSQNKRFDLASFQTQKKVRSGQYAIEFPKKKGELKAMVYTFDTIQAGAIYKASVWRYRADGGKNGLLVVEGKGAGAFKKSESITSREKDGWEEIQLFFSLPQKTTLDTLQVYIASAGGHLMYFDDLTIQKIERSEDLLVYPDWQRMNIRLEDKSLRKLDAKRMTAYRAGILESREDDWVKARINIGDSEKELKAQLRLKGDWLDHLNSNKWSFRIKLKGNDRWNRLSTFSIHTPKARSYLSEYVLHRFFEKEGILTPRYDFLTVSVNGKSKGVFAFEEHFEKILVESQKRREGPIVRMSEDGFWAGVKRQMTDFDGIDNDIEQSVRKMETSDIEAFKQGKTIASATLSKQFKVAQNLLYQYRYGLQSAEDIFDIDQMARFYAICDVMGAYHGLAWHNQRFYYNPVTSKLEPIGFDGFGSSVSKRNSILGQGALNPRKLSTERLDNKLFMNPVFTEKYIRYLRQYCSTDYIGTFMEELERELSAKELLLQSEFKNYQFNREDFIKNVKRVGTLMLPYNNLSVKAYLEKKEEGQQFLQVANIHNLPIEIIGSGSSKKSMSHSLEEPLLLEGFLPRKLLAWTKDIQHSEKPNQIFNYGFTSGAHQEQSFLAYQGLSVAENTKYLFFRPLGVDSIFHCEIKNWQAPHNSVPAQELFANAEVKSNDWMTVDGTMIYFRKGTHQIKERIIIPAGYHVFFEAGTQLDFINRAGLISRSPVFMNGTEDESIVIQSSDHSATGFTVLQAPEQSKMRYVVFDHFNTLEYKGWTLTGAVTFYESDVAIDQTVFKNNHCEDGLNIVRSEFTMKNSLVSYTAFDGFDADFCKGKIESCRFYETGNDGMDFSGSNIFIDGCTVENSGDKGLSVGEDTDATVYDLTVKNAVIGVASKDLSLLIIKNINLENCAQGFAAYQKKPEFGGSKILVNNYSANNIRRLYNIRKGCELTLKGLVIKGEE